MPEDKLPGSRENPQTIRHAGAIKTAENTGSIWMSEDRLDDAESRLEELSSELEELRAQIDDLPEARVADPDRTALLHAHLMGGPIHTASGCPGHVVRSS